MKLSKSLAFKNCIRKPGRSIALVMLSVFLCFIILGGSLLINGLKSGLKSLNARLGADIMVVPYEATTKSSLSGIILQGNPGYFYMKDSIADEIESTEGIAESSRQFFLASASSSCCSYKVQLIGFDPETDFTITPWVEMSYKGDLGYMEVLVGNDLNAFAGDELTFYGTTVKVAAKLEKTGTYLDTAVYANTETIKDLIAKAKESKIYDFSEYDPDKVVSCVLINVADGYSVDEVMNDINIHVKGVEAIKTQEMVSDVTTKLTGISDLAGTLIVVVWLLALIILMISFMMITNERKKEFAVLRVIGVSRSKLSFMMFKEAFLLCITGSTVGALLAVIVSNAFSKFIESSLNMPFLLPKAYVVAIMAVCSIVISIIASILSSVVSVKKISKIDAALILRGEN